MAIKHGFGTTFKWNDAPIAGLTNIGGVDVTTAFANITTHQSVGAFEEFLPGVNTAADLPIAGFLDVADAAGQIAMAADKFSGAMRTGIITFPAATGATWTFTAFISGLKIGEVGLDGAIPFTASLKITGVPVFAIATATGMSALTLSNSAVVSPTFAIGTFDYVATILNAVAGITFTPTSAAGTITLTAPNGAAQNITSTQASSTIAMAVGVNTVVIVISEANKAPKTYTFRVVRAAS